MSARLRTLWIVEFRSQGEAWQPLLADAEQNIIAAFTNSERASLEASPSASWLPGTERRVVRFVVSADDAR